MMATLPTRERAFRDAERDAEMYKKRLERSYREPPP
jgi:hypothetical protein